MPNSDVFVVLKASARFCAFLATSDSYHPTYCCTTYSGLLISIGATKNKAAHPKHARINFFLSSTKKKKAKPITPYSLMKMFKTMKKAAHTGFFFSMQANISR